MQQTRTDPKEWVAAHGDALYAYALRQVRDRAVAEDLVQDTLLAALKGRASFAGASTERTWLIGILKNKVVDHYRKAGREESLFNPEQLRTSDVSDYVLAGPDAGTWQPDRRPMAWSVDPNDPVEQQQFWAQLQRCLEDLDDRSARVYTLRDVMDIDYEDVCNVLEVTPTNLRVRLYRARKLLRRCLETHWIKA